MINTRLLYIPIEKIENATECFLDISHHIDQAVYLKPVNNHFYVYGNNSELLTGIECVGREEDFYHHDTYKIRDFNAHNVEKKEISFNSYQELEQKIKEEFTSIHREWFRVEFDSNKVSMVAIYFFDNLEK